MTYQVAQTIAQQLGGGKFVAMTGAKLLGSPDSLHVRLGHRTVVIKLEADDTYTVSLHKLFKRKGRYVQPAPVVRSPVYCDMLQEVFTELTGLYTHL